LASYEKDHRFLTEGKKLGWRVYLMTSARLRDAGWRRDSVDDILFMPGDQVLKLFGLNDGASHTEFIRSRDTGELFFLETSARVGEAHIPELTEAGTGANLWSEWAKLESSLVTGLSYSAPEVRHDQAGLLVSCVQQEWPDTSVFSDPEVVWKVAKRHHMGLVVSSPDGRRVAELMDSYTEIVRKDFYATAPPQERVGY
jgi:hypothetical protein